MAADLRAAILERVDQLEATAQQAGRDRTPPWTADEDPEDPHVTARMQLVPDPITVTDAETVNIARHVATWDPDAVLTLCTGARELVEIHAPVEGRRALYTNSDHERLPGLACRGCDHRASGGFAHSVWTCPTLRATARMLGIDPDPT